MQTSKSLMLVAMTMVLLSFTSISVLRAQTDRGTITGTVTDPSGGTVAGATVTATHVSTGLQTKTVTRAGGNYTIPYLQIGKYNVAVSMTGFKEFVQEGVVLDVGQTVVVSVTLQLGNVTQRVEVTAQAPQLQSTTTTLSTAASSVEVESLPLFSQAEMRNPAFFMVLDSSTSGRGVSNNGQGIFSNRALATTVAGSQSASTQFEVDGSRLVVPGFLFSAYGEIAFPQDAVQEFTLTTITPPAEMGNSGGGITSFTLKSGTNRFHGSGFEYLRNDDLDANTFFANSSTSPGCNSSGEHVSSGGTQACRPPLKQNEFGGTLGGPIIKNKLFFFGWYDGFRLVQGAEASVVNVPTAAEKQGNFSAFETPIYDPATTAPDGSGGYTRTPFQGEIIPTTRFDSVASAPTCPIPQTVTSPTII